MGMHCNTLVPAGSYSCTASLRSQGQSARATHQYFTSIVYSAHCELGSRHVLAVQLCYTAANQSEPIPDSSSASEQQDFIC